MKSIKITHIAFVAVVQFLAAPCADAQTANDNYIRTYHAQTPITTDLSTVNDKTRVSVSGAYFDGLGRVTQSVQVQQSPLGFDIVQPVAYDSLGRVIITYLPYISGNDGALKTNFIRKENSSYATSANAQYQFYQGTAQVATDTRPYSVTMIEQSELNRVVKQGAPGLAWQPNANATNFTDNAVKKKYGSNGDQEVFLFTYSSSSGLITVNNGTTRQYYTAGQLMANRTFDEHNNEVIEYTDKRGHVVCKKVQYAKINNVTQYASTYYIYDALNNLVVVLPPEAVSALTK